MERAAKERVGESRLLYVLPSLALGAVLFAWLEGLAPRSIRSAEVYGGPLSAEGPAYVRVLAREEWHGVERGLAEQTLYVTWRGPKNEREKKVTTGPDGWVDVELPRPEGAEHLALVVRDEDDAVLVEGTPRLELNRWRAAARRRGGRLGGASQGAVTVLGRVEEAVLAVPFVGHVSFSLRRGDAPVRATVEASAGGAEILGSARFELEEGAEARVALRPLEHTSSFELRIVTPEGELTRYQTTLPVVPGAFSFEPSGGGFTILSPLARDEAWATFVTEDERGPGLRVPLDAEGRGVIPSSLVPRGEGRYLVLASSPDGRSPATVGYPLDGASSSFDAVDARLLDGRPARVQKEEARQRSVRIAVAVHVGLVGLVTLGLFLARVRRAERELERSWAGVAPELGGMGKRSRAWVGIGVFCLVLGFSLALVWIVVSEVAL